MNGEGSRIDLVELLEQTLDWSRRRNYAGWDYADGLSSPLLERLPIENQWLNLAVQETAKRAPVNVRPLFGIPRRRSFKGSALFISANLTAYEATGEERYLREATRLGEWLLANRRDRPFGWGHNHRLQTLHGIVPRNTPTIVTVTYASRALMRLGTYRDLPICADLPDLVRTLLVEDLSYERCPDGARIRYWAEDSSGPYVVNANALGAGLLVDLAAAYDAPHLLDLAEPIYDYVAARQAPSGGWYYADPPEGSHLSMDNHHNGFVLEAFLRHREATGDDRYADVIDRGIEFYRDTLHDPDGAPRWDESTAYPRDIHAAAQGIITFAHADRPAVARRILGWTTDNLYAGDGRFHYRQGRFLTKRVTLMRWCQAWMAHAVATLHDRTNERELAAPSTDEPLVRQL